MIALVVFLLFLAGLLFKPKVLLEEETAAFRHPFVVLMRKRHGRVRASVDLEKILAHKDTILFLNCRQTLASRCSAREKWPTSSHNEPRTKLLERQNAFCSYSAHTDG
jgi:hypothetical protein